MIIPKITHYQAENFHNTVQITKAEYSQLELTKPKRLITNLAEVNWTVY